MATNTGHGTRAFGHFGGSVVRASRAKPRLSVGLDFQHLHGVVFGVEHRELRVYACGGVGVQTHFLQTLGDGLGDQGRCQIGIGSQQTVTDRVGCGPFAAAVAVHLIELAQHARALAIRPVVQLFFQLVFNQLALFFHHHDLLQTFGELARALRLQGPDHADFVHANT